MLLSTTPRARLAPMPRTGPIATYPAAPALSTHDHLAAGRAAELTGDRTEVGPIPRRPAYFRTFDQMRDAMYALQAKYPTLVRVEDIGDSGDKVRGTAPSHDILALRLTAQAAPAGRSLPLADRPKVLWLGGVHAREIANPELLLGWAEKTLAGYGTDAGATALLDTRQLLVVPVVNPDGHAVVERGFDTSNDHDLWQRKDTTAPDGTDLNRNFEHAWGGVGAGRNPKDGTYAGTAPASEAETQAIESFVRAEKPAIAVDWHSFSRLNLYPWGDSFGHAPEDVPLNQLAKKFSTFNGYVAEQSSDLYLNSGASDDWMYDTLKPSPAFTIETGDSFHQDDAEFAQTVAQNMPVLDWMARAADAPYAHALGPDIAAPTVGNGRLSATAVATDTRNVQGPDPEPGRRPHPPVVPTPIVAAEWFTNPATAPGAGTPMAAADGSFDATTEALSASLEGVRDGATVWLRARDADGHWGAATATFARIPAPAPG